MSKVAIALFVSMLLFDQKCLSQNCTLSGTAGWSEQLREVVDGCDIQLSSPNRNLLLEIDAEGKIWLKSIVSAVVRQIDSKPVEPPATVSWSPKSDAFFVNDGEGSGMASTLRFFRVQSGGQAVEDTTIGKKIVAAFRARNSCPPSDADPNVWGFGWSKDGSRVYLLAQTTVDHPCGLSGSFRGMEVRLSDDSIIRELSEADMKREFHGMLPIDIFPDEHKQNVK